ncbi:MAG TPA: thioredoxin domain-containing protein [Gemmatimonadaceae bacterium]|nr:thioredoxin domain-containing protein [Gemmatimonadaceae bacterium]
MPNRLARETSPYLRQHAHNPVDWYPWGSEALERARREDRPILLSIGYAACHWCHVMERESFEDPDTARLMNDLFVNIKVDREERPDLDAIYMNAVQAMTGHGGWPMTVFLTPDGVPFVGGTYFPPDDRRGMPSFRRVLRAVHDAYTNRRGDVDRAAEALRELYDRAREPARGTGTLTPAMLEDARRALVDQADAEHGGFGGAPKFPNAMALDFLLRCWRRTGDEEAREVVVRSMRAMVRGGIFDQVGGGFHRYAVDARWLVPHFEKMLYDNALLARLAIHLWQVTGDAEMRAAAESTVAWLRREMMSPDGAFAASLDADSEGEEGRFYLWTADEMRDVLGDDAPLVERYFGVTQEGNFEGRNILHVPLAPEAAAAHDGTTPAALADTIARASRALREARDARVRPLRDDKVLAGWNALMVRTLAEMARILGDAEQRAMALRAGELLVGTMVRDGRVARLVRADGSALPGYLEDQAGVGLAALALYELTFDARWVEHARTLATRMLDLFWDNGARAFFDTASDHEPLIARPREVTDNAIPSGTSLAAELLLRLAELGQDDELRRRAEWVLATLAEPMARYPLAFGHLLGVADMAVHGAVEVALAGDPRADDFVALERAVAATYVPALVLAGTAVPTADVTSAPIALLEGRSTRDGRAAAYVCRRYVCDAPATSAEQLVAQLESAAASG